MQMVWAERPALLLPAATLWQRELVRFARDRHRLFGAVGQPVLFWALMGAGLNASFLPAGQVQGMRYIEYIYPGTLLLILLFTAIFSTISVVEDRREGFLQSVLVAPVSGFGLVLGKVLGGTTLAVLEAAVFLIFALQVGIPLSLPAAAATLGYLALIALALTGLGFVIAWRMESTAGFHAVMNLFLLPMWLLSGAFFPLSGAPAWLEWTMRANPLTYGMAGLRQALYLSAPLEGADLPPQAVCLPVMALFALLMLWISVRSVGRRQRGGGG